jgi:hypothetical protein
MNLASMDFRRSSLKDADFRRAFLVEAQFDQADVSGAHFDGANLFESSLSYATGVEEASCDRYTKLPEGLACAKGFITEAEPEPEPDPEEAAPLDEAGPVRARRTSKDRVRVPKN